MILNYPSKSQKYNQTQVHKSMKSSTYPVQDKRYINLLVALSYRDEKNEDTIWRLKYSEKSHRYHYDSDSIFMVLRCDAEYPYKAILINIKGDVIVTSSTILTNISTPSSFSGMQHRYQKDSTPFEREFAELNFLDDYDPYTDFIHLIPAQDKEFLGMEGYTEYENDLVKKNNISDRESQAIEQEDPNYHSVERRYNDVVRVYPKIDETSNLHPESVTSFPLMHYIHDKNYIDKPFATRNPAVIIRTDRNRENVVFMERAKSSEDDGTVLRFLTGDEVFFYYESEDQFIVERENIEPEPEDVENYEFAYEEVDQSGAKFDFHDEDMFEDLESYELDLGDNDTDKFTHNPDDYNFGDVDNGDKPEIPGIPDDDAPEEERIEQVYDYGYDLRDHVDDTSTFDIKPYVDLGDEDEYYLEPEKTVIKEPKILARYKYEFNMNQIIEEIINGRIQL